MKIIINPTKPFYVNNEESNIRCGNFPETGKEISTIDDNLITMFHDLKVLTDYNELESKYTKIFNISQHEFKENIDYLMEEGFIVSEEQFNKLFISERYNRQDLFFYMLSNNNTTVQEYKDKKIGILGLGGIGSTSIELLCRAGFEHFITLDCDKVEESNLIRQLAYYNLDVGKFKGDVIKKRLLEINRRVNISNYQMKIEDLSQIPEEFKECDIILCTIDKPYRKIRRIVNEFCVRYNITVIFSGFAEHVGFIGPFIVPHKTACLECIDKKENSKPLENVNVAPSFGPLCTIISSIASSEIINYFTQYKDTNLQNTTLMFNMYDYTTNKVNWKKDINCKMCGDKYDN